MLQSMKKKLIGLIGIAICLANAYFLWAMAAQKPTLPALYIVSFVLTVNAVAGIIAVLKSDDKDGEGINNEDEMGDDDEKPR